MKAEAEGEAREEPQQEEITPEARMQSPETLEE